MGGTTEIKRQLETATDAIEAHDADLAAGRLSPEEHARLSAAREREIGHLYVQLRRARRGSPERHPVPPPARPAPRPSAIRRPAVIGAGAILLLVAGVGAGVAVGRWVRRSPSDGPPPATRAGIDLALLRQQAAQPDAPIPTLLRAAHLALDEGRLGEAQQLYERVLAREPRSAEAVNHLGAVLYAEGRVDEALGKVEEALGLDPRYIHALWDRVQYLFHDKRDFPGTVRAAEAFLAVLPQGPDADQVRALMAEARRQSAPGAAPAPKG